MINNNNTWVRGHSIGRGSFGTVSLALSQLNTKLFAVKSVQITGGDDTHQLQALENEIRILEFLSSSPSPSPWIVDYIGDDVTFEKGFSYRNLHMEYMPGGTPVISTDEDEVKSYTWCLVSALRYIHSKGITHCDVKGSNVLLGKTPGVAKLADFGSAMLGYNHDAPPRVRGSPLWMAPEVIRGEYQGPESDVWSLGCTVIEMMTGKPAWEDKGYSPTLIEIGYTRSNLPVFPSSLSKIGRDFLEKCLRRDREERWSCDMLLRHPFISSSEPSNTKLIVDCPSPRLVLDWAWMEPEFLSSEEADVDSVKVRIQKLATTKREVNWESDGWSEVRNLVGKQRDVECSSSSNSDQNRGANMECEDSGTNQSVINDGYATTAAGEEDGAAACKSQFNKKSDELTFSLLYLFFKCKFIILLLMIHNFHPFGHSKYFLFCGFSKFKHHNLKMKKIQFFFCLD